MNALRLAVGTLTAFPIRPPATVDRSTARIAALLAPLAALPLAVAAWLVGRVSLDAGLSPTAGAVLVVGALALATRGIHWDGLSDTVDGLSASYERDRALAAMRTSTSGPTGTLALVLVALAQVIGVSELLGRPDGAILVALLVVVARLALPTACTTPIPAARRDGLGNVFTATVPVLVALALWGLATVAVVGAGERSGLDTDLLALVPLLALLFVAAVLVRCVRRLGGVTGDVFGAVIEVAFAALVLGASAAA